ncbi:MAG: hypothetical protein J6D18_02810, partial [Erysipelotrichaceae bacterium]|nr:hypothetical protein [Erysipelotrichaceae bacterium]
MRKRLWSLIPFFVFVMILFGFSMKPISAEEVTPQETEEITETTQVQPEQANEPAQVETATESQGQGDSANAQPNT